MASRAVPAPRGCLGWAWLGLAEPKVMRLEAAVAAEVAVGCGLWIVFKALGMELASKVVSGACTELREPNPRHRKSQQQTVEMFGCARGLGRFSQWTHAVVSLISRSCDIDARLLTEVDVEGKREQREMAGDDLWIGPSEQLSRSTMAQHYNLLLLLLLSLAPPSFFARNLPHADMAAGSTAGTTAYIHTELPKKKHAHSAAVQQSIAVRQSITVQQSLAVQVSKGESDGVGDSKQGGGDTRSAVQLRYSEGDSDSKQGGEDTRSAVRLWSSDGDGDSKECMAYIQKWLPDMDKGVLTPDQLKLNIDLALAMGTWAREVPWKIFLNFVLPHANLDEPRDDWRHEFVKHLAPLVSDAGVHSLAEAVHLINKHVWGIWGITFRAGQTPEIMSPSQVIEHGYASCTGTPDWKKHAGAGSTVGADLAGLNFGMPAGGASSPAKHQIPGSKMHAIYAVSYAPTENNVMYPLIWDDSFQVNSDD
eukprot:gene24829-10482_t